MSFFDFGNEQTGNFEASTGGDFAPIPKGTVVKVIAEEVKWKTFEPNPEFIEIKWSITEGEYKNRKIFQKVKTQDSDPQKAKKAMAMLGAINFNAKGGLERLTTKPTDAELTNALTFKPMYLKLDVWKITTETGEEKTGNHVVAVSSTQGTAPKPQQQAVSTDDDLPF